jgi:hypothetical protein
VLKKSTHLGSRGWALGSPPERTQFLLTSWQGTSRRRCGPSSFGSRRRRECHLVAGWRTRRATPRANAGTEEILKQNHSFVFTLIHKFNQLVDEKEPYSERDDIIVISDEAHRTPEFSRKRRLDSRLSYCTVGRRKADRQAPKIGRKT